MSIHRISPSSEPYTPSERYWRISRAPYNDIYVIAPTEEAAITEAYNRNVELANITVYEITKDESVAADRAAEADKEREKNVKRQNDILKGLKAHTIPPKGHRWLESGEKIHGDVDVIGNSRSQPIGVGRSSSWHGCSNTLKYNFSRPIGIDPWAANVSSAGEPVTAADRPINIFNVASESLSKEQAEKLDETSRASVKRAIEQDLSVGGARWFQSVPDGLATKVKAQPESGTVSPEIAASIIQQTADQLKKAHTPEEIKNIIDFLSAKIAEQVQPEVVNGRAAPLYWYVRGSSNSGSLEAYIVASSSDEAVRIHAQRSADTLWDLERVSEISKSRYDNEINRESIRQRHRAILEEVRLAKEQSKQQS